MKTKSTRLLLLFFLLPLSLYAQVQIGDGDETGEYLPVSPDYGYTYSQTIYLKSEIGNSGGNITTLKYYFDGDGISKTNNWTIYMGHTSKTSFSGSSDWIPVSQLTKVFSDTIPNPGTSGWVTIDIDDFTYNGSDNLVIAVDENQDDYDGSGEYFFCTSADSARSIVYTDDYDNPDPTSPPDGDTENYIPNIILGGIVYEKPIVSTVGVTGKTRTSARIKGNITDPGVGNVTSYGVCWDTTGSPTISDNHTDEGSVSSTGEFTSQLSGLIPSKTYIVRAYAANSVGVSYGSEIKVATVPGYGTQSDPYQISTLADLAWVSDNYYTWGSYFIQMADINAGDTRYWDPQDLDGDPSTPVTFTGFQWWGYTGVKFTGSYDGKDHVIDSLNIDIPTGDMVGLFGFTLGATIKNLGLTNVNISAASEVGGLVGRAAGQTNIENCYVTGRVKMDITQFDQGLHNAFGGLAGFFINSDITNCYSTADVVGHDNPGGIAGYRAASYVGGLVGENKSSTISNSFSTGDVDAWNYAGGFVGRNYSAVIKNCYSRGSVLENDGSTSKLATYMGGFCGENDNAGIQKCYSTGQVTFAKSTTPDSSGFLGTISPNVYNSDFSVFNNFWDAVSSGQSATKGSDSGANEYPVGKTTSEMKTQSTFTNSGWDFTNTWAMDSSVNDGYPYLRWKTVATDVKNNLSLLPKNYSLSQNYPNPFNPTTRIKFVLPKAGQTTIRVYNILGQLVATLVNRRMRAGQYTISWDAHRMSSGMYLYRIKSGDYMEVKKMILMK